VEQDQDISSIPIEKLKAQIVREIRDIVRYGASLTRDHCRKMRTLASLSHVWIIMVPFEGAADSPASGGFDSHSEPRMVRELLEATIDRLLDKGRSSEPSLLSQAETLVRLFGFTKSLRRSTTRRRWMAAMEYYQEHGNLANRVVTEENFRRRIVGDGLLPLVADELMAWEQELQSHMTDSIPAISMSAAWILFRWRAAYWALFRVRSHLRDFLIHLDAYIHYRVWKDHPYPPMRLLPPGELGVRYSSDEIGWTLFSLGIVFRFARNSQLFRYRDGIDRNLDLLQVIFDTLLRDYSFSRPDQEWLDRAIDEQMRQLDYISATTSPGWFIGQTIEDSRGKAIVQKFLVTTLECQCSFDPYASKDLPISQWTPHEKKDCAIGKLQLMVDEFAHEVDNMWLVWADVLGNAYSQGIPPVSS
jgi:hypothetical protein